MIMEGRPFADVAQQLLAAQDTQFLSDRGGWHQFAVDKLGMNWKVGPKGSKVFEFTALAIAATYA